MSDRFNCGLSLIEASFELFEGNARLALLPVLSLLSVGSAFALLAAIAFRLGVVDSLFTNDLVEYSALFAAIAISSSVATFFNAAVAHCTAKLIDGEETSVRDGLSAAWRVRRKIALWAITAATLGTALRFVDEKLGFFGSVARLFFDVGWSLLTFFVVPVMVLEDESGVRSMLRRSGSAFADTWGESVTTSFGIGLVFLPVTLPALAALFVGYFLLHGLAALVVGAVGGLLLVAVMVASQTVSMIARTALYRYATTGERVGPFEQRDPATFFAEK